jgi:hypothetical protein
MKLLLSGDSFAADWTKKYKDQSGWPNQLSALYDVTNIAQAAVSEYKILKQIKSIDLIDYHGVIISHSTASRVHCNQHPIHHNDFLHGNADLIYNDIKEHYDNHDARIAINYFERYYDPEYYQDITRLLCMDILNTLAEYPDLNQIHLVNYHNTDIYHFLPSININPIFSKHPGLMNHLDDIGNKKLFDMINACICQW